MVLETTVRPMKTGYNQPDGKEYNYHYCIGNPYPTPDKPQMLTSLVLFQAVRLAPSRVACIGFVTAMTRVSVLGGF